MLTSLLIGKDPRCDIVFPGDRYVSNRHCRIYRRASGARYVWVVADAGSTNGTWIERRLSATPLPPYVRETALGRWRIPTGFAVPLEIGDVVWLGLRTPLPVWDGGPA